MIPADVTIAFDSNILAYFIQAARGDYDPTADLNAGLRAERVAAFRLFLFGPQLHIVPTVYSEVNDIRGEERRTSMLSWIHNMFLEVLPEHLDEHAVAKAEETYLRLHDGRKDCRAVAEAEVAGLHWFATFDRNLRSRLAGNTARNVVQTASQCWESLAIPRGTTPKWVPAPSNPLARFDWWRW